MLAEDFQLLIDRLQDEELRQLALARMDGKTNEEISRELGTSVRTVECRLELIRKMWTQDSPDDERPGIPR